MNADTKNLARLIKFHKNLQHNEVLQHELEEHSDITEGLFDFWNAYGALSENLSKAVNYANLTEKGQEKFKALSLETYNRLKYDYPQLMGVHENIDATFSEAYEAAKAAAQELLSKYPSTSRPILPCGFASLDIHVPPYSLVDNVLRDEALDLEGFIYQNNRVEFDTAKFCNELGLTGQEFEIFEKSYAECAKVLSEKLGIRGSITSFID